MLRLSDSEKRMLKLMLVDCDLHHMTEQESIVYINKRFGRQISRRTYYNYKDKVYQGKNHAVRFIPKWIKGIHLASMLHEMENTP